MSKASDYFNSLPEEQRRQLAPLLNEYRLLGMQEYSRAIADVQRQMSERIGELHTGIRIAELQSKGLEP